MAGVNENEFGISGAEDDCHLLTRKSIQIEPFNPVIYNLERVGRLEEVISPPYDVMTPQEREKYALSHPFNIVHILLPRQACEDIERSAAEYERAGAMTRQWLKEGILITLNKPSVFPYRQLFKKNGGEVVEQWSLIAALQLREYSTGAVRPHEMTTGASKQDRLMLLRATRLEMSQVYGLFIDEEKSIDGALFEIAMRRKPWLSVIDDKGISHSIWRIDDADLLSDVRSALQNSWILIADGHHRYESAIAYLRERWRNEGALSEDDPVCYIGMALANLCGQITILPTHCLLHFLSPNDCRMLVEWLIKTFKCCGRVEPVGTVEALKLFCERADEDGAVSFAISYRDAALTLWARVDELSKLGGDDMGERKKLINAGVNTSVLYELLLPMALQEIDGLSTPQISYTQDAIRAIDVSSNSENVVAVMLRPVKREQLIYVAELGLRLPPKSTYFYPKIPSGLIMRMV